MKKVLFSMLLGAMCITVASVFTSCDGAKKEAQKIGEYELTENAGKLGLKDGSHIILDAKYDKITDAPSYKAIFAEKGDLTTIVSNGYVVLEDIDITAFEPTGNPDYVYVKSASAVRLWQPGTSYVVGPFADIKLIDNIVFLNDDGKWGAATTDHNGLAPRKFDKLFIVKNGDKMAVLVKDKSGWALYDQNGVSDGQRYDTSSKVLDKQVKALKLSDDIGVIDVKWAL